MLKGFAASDGRLAVFDSAHRQRKLRSPGAGIFTTNFDSWDSQGAEERWNLFEVKFPATLARVEDRTASSDAATIGVLKDMLALHWLRSRAMVEARNQAVERSFERYRKLAPDARPDHLAAALQQETGLIATSRSALEWTVDRIIKDVRTNELAKWHSQQNSEYFQTARSRFEQLELHLHYTSARDLAIGDSPVITIIEGRFGAGPHQNVGIMKADHVAMPISPGALVTLGARPPNAHLSDAEVDLYNDLQWSTFDTWIAARPGGTADHRLKLEASQTS